MDPEYYARLDLTFLRDFCDGDEDQMDYFIQKFKKHGPEEMQKLKEALEREDREALAKAAHAFRPQLDFIGLKEDAARVFELEQQARNKCSFKELTEIFNRLTVL